MAEDVRQAPTGTSAVSHSFLSGVKYEHLIAGLSGGVVSTLATHPFDLIKLRFAGRRLFASDYGSCISFSNLSSQFMMVPK